MGYLTERTDPPELNLPPKPDGEAARQIHSLYQDRERMLMAALDKRDFRIRSLTAELDELAAQMRQIREACGGGALIVPEIAPLITRLRGQVDGVQTALEQFAAAEAGDRGAGRALAVACSKHLGFL